TVRDKQLTARGLKASYLGGPVTIDLKPGARENVVYAQGRTSAAALADVFAVPGTLGLEGPVDWKAVTRITPGQRGADGTSPPPVVAVQIDSTLDGVAVNLPAPLDKAAAGSRALSVSLRWPQRDVMQVRGMYG